MSEPAGRIVAQRLEHMAAAAAAIEEYAARGRDEFDADPVLRDAMLYQIVVLGEAAKAVLATDPDLARRIPGVDRSPMRRPRAAPLSATDARGADASSVPRQTTREMDAR